jgi:hypothetical protein
MMTYLEDNVNAAHGITDLLMDIFMSGVPISEGGRSGLVVVLDCLKQRIPTDGEMVVFDRIRREQAENAK